MDKYYIPHIDEFFNNFEYEYYQDGKWNTEAFTIYSPVLVADVIFKLKNDLIRVKFLDKNDIVELGFNHEYGNDFIYKNGIKIKTIGYDYSDYIGLTQDKKNNHVWIGTSGMTIYNGIIKNKSKLKIILEMLTVYNIK